MYFERVQLELTAMKAVQLLFEISEASTLRLHTLFGIKAKGRNFTKVRSRPLFANFANSSYSLTLEYAVSKGSRVHSIL